MIEVEISHSSEVSIQPWRSLGHAWHCDPQIQPVDGALSVCLQIFCGWTHQFKMCTHNLCGTCQFVLYCILGATSDRKPPPFDSQDAQEG